ncbi:MAG TPA: BrnT family toxin [Pyrinomonadaceae bacterium]|nr:BrnT family toxin [Pyrinomonadaceae bacterium]
MDLEFESDEEKAASNVKKHKITFEEAKTAFADPLAITIDDPKHSVDERRFIDIGISAWKYFGLILILNERRYA